METIWPSLAQHELTTTPRTTEYMREAQAAGFLVCNDDPSRQAHEHFVVWCARYNVPAVVVFVHESTCTIAIDFPFNIADSRLCIALRAVLAEHATRSGCAARHAFAVEVPITQAQMLAERITRLATRLVAAEVRYAR